MISKIFHAVIRRERSKTAAHRLEIRLLQQRQREALRTSNWAEANRIDGTISRLAA